MRRGVLVLLVVLAGCRSTAMEHWMVGQLELEAGNLDAAIVNLKKSRRRDPQFAPSYLALAAAYTKTGDFQAVADNLAEYVLLNPEHKVAHVYLAECLMSLGKDAEAEIHFQCYVHDVQACEQPNRQRLVHCYERLSEIADRRDHSFQRNLYEGIVCFYRGQELLESSDHGAERAESATDPDTDNGSANKTFAKALDRLRAAKAERPRDAQVRFYLAQVLAALGEKEAVDRLGEETVASASGFDFSEDPELRKQATQRRISHLVLEQSKLKR